MHVAPPPFWQTLLLENPWPAVIALGAVAAVLRLLAVRQQRGGLTWAALGAILLALGVYLLASFVTTSHERLLMRTRQLVHATAPLDVAVINRLLAPQATLTGPHGEVWLTYDRIRPELQGVTNRFTFTDQHVRDAAAEVTAPHRGHTLFALTTKVARQGFNVPVRTVWSLRWRQAPDGRWRVTEIRWLRFEGHAPRSPPGLTTR